MHVEELMTRQVKSCSPGDTLAEAARIMWDSDCGCLPVCSDNGARHLEGVITDRDICMSALFQGKSLNELRVADVMSTKVQTCRPGDSPDKAESIMASSRIRRLPVVDAEDSLIGMISLADLAREAKREQDLKSRTVQGSEVGLTLASICEPSRH